MIIRHIASTAAIALTLAVVGESAHAGAITYDVNQTIGSGSVTGAITTDGALGVLSVSDIVSWNLSLNGIGASATLNPSNSDVSDRGSDVTATASDLFFNFSGGDNGRLLFQTFGGEGGQTYYCNASGNADCLQGKSDVPVYYSDGSSQFAPTDGNQIIGVSAVPLPAALPLFATGLLGLGALGWRKTRRKAT